MTSTVLIAKPLSDYDDTPNPLADQLETRYSIELTNLEAMLPEGTEVMRAFGYRLFERRQATDDECRQFRIELSSLEFDVEGDIGSQAADQLERLAAELLLSAKEIRGADLTWDADEHEEVSVEDAEAA